MTKSENKTKETKASVTAFINSIEHPTRKRDAKSTLALMKKITGEKPKMWGSSIIGFGTYHYKYDSGREGDFLITGFSPRKAATTLYIMAGFSEYDALLAKLGKHKIGKSCLYVNNFDDIDMKVLDKLVTKSVAWMRKKYKT